MLQTITTMIEQTEGSTWFKNSWGFEVRILKGCYGEL